MREPNRGLKKASEKARNANHTFSRGKEGLGQVPREKQGGRVCGKRAAQSSGLLCKQRETGRPVSEVLPAVRERSLKERGMWCACVCAFCRGRKTRAGGRGGQIWEPRVLHSIDNRLPSPILQACGLSRGPVSSSLSIPAAQHRACYKVGAQCLCSVELTSSERWPFPDEEQFRQAKRAYSRARLQPCSATCSLTKHFVPQDSPQGSQHPGAPRLSHLPSKRPACRKAGTPGLQVLPPSC